LYEERNQIILQLIQDLHENNQTIDHIIMANAVKQKEVDGLRDRLFEILTLPYNYSIQTYNEYTNIIYEKYYRRVIIEEFYPVICSAYDESVPVNDIVTSINNNIDKYIFLNSEDNLTTAEKVINNTLALMEKENSGDVKNAWKTGNNILDEILYYGPGHITLLGGKGGSGKTRWLIYLMLGLLRENPDISILWYNLEDSNEKIMRCIIGHYLKIEEDEIRGRKGSMLELHLPALNTIQENIKKYDIKFNDRSDTIDGIYREFMKFVAIRKNRFCILIIDNLMLLEDHSYKRNATDIDDYISRKLRSILNASNKLSNMGASIIPIHHFTKDQSDKLNLKDGYRPKEEHLKGSGRFKDVATQVVLLNRPDMYKDLLLEYKHISHIMSRLFITEITKNRDGKTGVIRWFCDLGTTSFVELNKTMSHE
jgi:replicative DNA helicase